MGLTEPDLTARLETGRRTQVPSAPNSLRRDSVPRQSFLLRLPSTRPSTATGVVVVPLEFRFLLTKVDYRLVFVHTGLFWEHASTGHGVFSYSQVQETWVSPLTLQSRPLTGPSDSPRRVPVPGNSSGYRHHHVSYRRDGPPRPLVDTGPERDRE